MKLPRLGINFYKVAVGVVFSLLWARVMYAIWVQPSFLIFVLFYLAAGSVLLKWGIFEIIDRVYLRIRLRRMRRELEEARLRARRALAERAERSSRTVTDVENTEITMRHIEDEVLSLSNMVGVITSRAMESLTRRDMVAAREAIEYDQGIDLKEAAIRNDCIRIVSNRRFQTGEVRTIIAVLGIIVELERMGDYAEGIARITLMMGKRNLLPLPEEIPQMAQKGISMMEEGIRAFLDGDANKAADVAAGDDEIDARYDHVFRDLILEMVQDPKTTAQATYLVWVAHNLERFGDRATNICEWAVFRVTGEKLEIGAA